MRDIIWTVIVLWLAWKIVDAIKGVSQKKSQTQGYNSQTYKREGEVKINKTGNQQKTHFKPEDGEYVDYEEIK